MQRFIAHVLALLVIAAAASAADQTVAPHVIDGKKAAGKDRKLAELRPGTLIVRFKDGTAPPAMDAALAGKAKKVHKYADANARGVGAAQQRGPRFFDHLAKVELADGVAANAALAQLRADPRVAYAEHDVRVSIDRTPSDPQYSALWGMAKIQAPVAWDASTGSRGVVVAVIDTGVDYRHPDLAANMWINTREIAANGVDDDGNGIVDDIHGINGMAGAPMRGDPMDDNSHGTHCAGTIGAVGDNGVGVAGVCWSVRLMACKFIGSGGSGDVSDAIACIQYAVQNGAHVLSNSWGGGGATQALQDAINAADAAGVLFVAAAGNSNTDQEFYPAAMDRVYCVAATAQNDARASFSNFGSYIDVAAPGVDIRSTVPGAGYASYSGTSMACPHVAGLAALIKARDPSLGSAQIAAIISSSSDDLGEPSWDRIYGHGRINAARAIALAGGDGGGGGDAVSPTVAFTQPANGARVSGTVALAADAQDNVGVVRVDFAVDGVVLGDDATAPYQFAWNTAGVADGQHSLTARAIDAAGNIGTAIITVAVANGSGADTTPPTLALLSPSDGATVSGDQPITLRVADDVGIARVEYRVDGALRLTLTSPPYDVTWRTMNYSDGLHTLTVTAYDAAGNTTAASATVTVANQSPIDTTPPTVAITAPADGATVAGIVTVSAGAEDAVGVVRVDFAIDGLAIGSATTAPYAIAWNTAGHADGPYTLTATAIDAAGNAASARIALAVANGTGDGSDTTPPTIALLSPQDGATVSGDHPVTVQVADDVGVARVEYRVDDVLRLTLTAPPYDVVWRTTNYSEGRHTLA
ncbi:MAG: S8 family serine peptidase, partial [Planctomycetes bacterium]|nr:S8 family serine peptidase [Planctomycetota bacterium]